MVRAGAVLLLSVSAQQGVSQLSENQILGRRVFQQSCAVCHTQPAPGAPIYGPVLYKDLIETNQAFMAELIRRGSGVRMPAFQYTLEPREINAILQYLKTLPKPSAQNGTKQDNPQD